MFGNLIGNQNLTLNQLLNSDNYAPYIMDLWEHFGTFKTYVTLKYILIGLTVAAIIYLTYWLVFVPVNWTRDLTDVGYPLHGKQTKSSKKDAINRLRRLRKTGDKLPPPYPNGWYGVIESEKLKCSEAINVNCIGQNLVVFRTESGKSHVLDAYCPHLGANLGVGGVVRGECIECPFHHWTFRGCDGVCDNIPYMVNGNIPKNARVKHWESCEKNGQIFLWYHCDGEQPWNLPEIKEITNGDWICNGRNEFLVNCHIQEIPENGSDVAHLNAVHGCNMLTGNDLRTVESFWGSFAKHIWDAKWMPPAENAPCHIATLDLKHSIRIFNKIEICKITLFVEQVGPGYVLLHMQSNVGPMIVLQSVIPVEPLVQKVIHRFYGPRHMFWFVKFAIWAESVMFERDMMAWNQKIFVDSPCLVKEDKLIKKYRLWYSQFYSSNSTTFGAAKDAMSW